MFLVLISVIYPLALQATPRFSTYMRRNVGTLKSWEWPEDKAWGQVGHKAGEKGDVVVFERQQQIYRWHSSVTAPCSIMSTSLSF